MLDGGKEDQSMRETRRMNNHQLLPHTKATRERGAHKRESTRTGASARGQAEEHQRPRPGRDRAESYGPKQTSARRRTHICRLATGTEYPRIGTMET